MATNPNDKPSGTPGPDHPHGPSNIAANGEGDLGPPDVSWKPNAALPSASQCIAHQSEQLGLAKAIADSLYVSDVFFGLQALPTEHREALLSAIGAAAETHAKLRTTYTGTLAGDFVRWCRGLFPGLGAHDLAELLAVSGIGLVERYRTELAAIVERTTQGGH